MTSSENDAIEDAHALVAELREIHARSRENAKEQGWGVPPEEEDRSPWSRAADMIERLTANLAFVNAERRRLLPTPPTDDEREALIAEVTTTLLDRIGAQRLSADLVRGVVTEWERRAGFRRQGPITDNDYHEGLEEGDMYNEGFKDALRGALEIVENNDKIDAITELVIALGEDEIK